MSRLRNDRVVGPPLMIHASRVHFPVPMGTLSAPQRSRPTGFVATKVTSPQRGRRSKDSGCKHPSAHDRRRYVVVSVKEDPPEGHYHRDKSDRNAQSVL